MTTTVTPESTGPNEILLQDLTNINELELEILKQVDLISRKVDNTFATFIGVLEQVREVSLVLLPRQGSDVEKGLHAVAAIFSVGKDVYKAHQRNKALDTLLETKMQIAAQKRDRIRRVKDLLLVMEGRQLKMLGQEAGKAYDISSLTNDANRELLYKNQDVMIAECRRTIYLRLIAEYLSKCYSAWTSGRQSPDNCTRPCMMDVNLVLVGAVLPKQEGKYLQKTLENGIARVSGGVLMAMHDQGIAATALICDHQVDGAFNFEDYADIDVGYSILDSDKNPILELEDKGDRHPSLSMERIVAWVMVILCWSVAYNALPETGMATWLKWVVGIIGGVVGGLILEKIVGGIIKSLFYKKADADYEQYVLNLYYDAAGYQNMEDPDMEKANLLQVGADSALTNLSGFEFTDEARRKYGITEDFERLAKLARIMDDYYIDPLLGLIPVVGDLIAMSVSVPFVYVSLVKVRSFPLTACVIYNYAKDYMFGLVPGVGDIIDAFYKMNKRNARLITGYMNGDPETVQEVQRRSFVSVIFTIVFIAVIVLVIMGIVELIKEL